MVCNAVMVTRFVDALRRMGSVAATVCVSGCNFVASGVAGWTVFGEALPLQWWGGASVLLLGVGLLTAPEGPGRPRPAKAA